MGVHGSIPTMSEFADICKVFLDAYLDAAASWEDFEQWLGRRPWAEDLLELEVHALEIGLEPRYTLGEPDDSGQCVVCGDTGSLMGHAICAGCSRRWVCFDCLTWDDHNEHFLCPLCEDDREYSARKAQAGPLRNSALADALAKL